MTFRESQGMISIEHNANLAPYHTFGLKAVARDFVNVATIDELREVLPLMKEPFAILGGGSNTIFAKEYCGMVVRIALRGIWLVSEDDDAVTIKVAAGVVWDELVRNCISCDWHGLENLIAIPGTVGASAVQNIGAYGSEAAETIVRVHAIDIASSKEITLSGEECLFGYRDSIFKHSLHNKVVITAVEYRLSKHYTPNISYKALADTIEQQNIGTPSAEQTADIIETMRWSKLPRPSQMGNAGSFFTNPVIEPRHYFNLKEKYPTMPSHPAKEGYKIPAAWLIEQCGLRGFVCGSCAIYEKNPLVLVNIGDASIDDVNTLSNIIIQKVNARFDISLKQEVVNQPPSSSSHNN